jgi:hypothetical protein
MTFTEPTEVRNLSIYCRDRESFWIRWNPPDPPTGEILNYTILQENKNLTHWKYTSCTWKNFTCVILDAKSVSSKIIVIEYFCKEGKSSNSPPVVGTSPEQRLSRIRGTNITVFAVKWFVYISHITVNRHILFQIFRGPKT